MYSKKKKKFAQGEICCLNKGQISLCGNEIVRLIVLVELLVFFDLNLYFAKTAFQLNIDAHGNFAMCVVRTRQFK